MTITKCQNRSYTTMTVRLCHCNSQYITMLLSHSKNMCLSLEKHVSPSSVSSYTFIYWQSRSELVLTDFALYVTNSLSPHWLRLSTHIIHTFIF